MPFRRTHILRGMAAVGAGLAGTNRVEIECIAAV